MSKTFCVNTIIAQTIQSYVQVPDYSDLREEIESHTFVQLLRERTQDPRVPRAGHFQRYKILFVTSDTVICEETEKTCNGSGRFEVRKIDLSEWDQWFDEYIVEGRSFAVQEMCWADGMRMYGAQVWDLQMFSS